jgi:hypothetical protein
MYSLSARLGEVVDGRLASDDYTPFIYTSLSEQRVHINRLEKQREPKEHERDLLICWDKTQHGLKVARDAFLPEIQYGLSIGKTIHQIYTVIGARMNRCLQRHFAELATAWEAFFKSSGKGFTSHALRSIANAVHWHRLEKDDTANRGVHTQAHLGHMFESTHVFYDRLLHEDGYQLVKPEDPIDKEVMKVELDKIKVAILQAQVPNSIKRKFEETIEQEACKLYKKKSAKKKRSAVECDE